MGEPEWRRWKYCTLTFAVVVVVVVVIVAQHWAEDIAEDVEEQCENFGRVSRVYVDEADPNGCVYVAMKDSAGGTATAIALHGRYFAKRKLACGYLTEAQYKAKVPDAAAAAEAED